MSLLNFNSAVETVDNVNQRLFDNKKITENEKSDLFSFFEIMHDMDETYIGMYGMTEYDKEIGMTFFTGEKTKSVAGSMHQLSEEISYIIKKMNIIIFQPPVSPGWLSLTKDTYIDSIELDHSNFLKNIASKYDNISFIDFYTNQNTTFHDSMFYNSIHYNYEGSEIFTDALLDTIQVRKLID